MADFIEGPYEVGKAATGIFIVSANGSHFAQVFGMPSKEKSANAQLLSRSWSMLALLEKAYPIIEEEAERRECAPHEGGEPCGYWREMADLANEIQAEIDRAKGKGGE